jgi:plastocyanin
MKRSRPIAIAGGGLGLIAVAGALMGLFAFNASAQPQAAATAAATTVTVTAGKPSEFAFKLSKTANIPAGIVKFVVTNKGSVPHSFMICKKAGTANVCVGTKTRVLNKGQSQTITVTLAKGTYEYLCTVAGHAKAGMKGQLGVGAGVVPPKPVSTTTTTTTKVPVGAEPTCVTPTTSTIQVNEFDYNFTFAPSTIHCGTVTFVVHNTGQLPHNLDLLGVQGGTTDYQGPGETGTFTVNLGPHASLGYQCDYPEHSSLGMFGSIAVVD